MSLNPEQLMATMQAMLGNLGLMPPDIETQRAMRAASHNNSRVYKAWDMFMTLIANGESASASMRKVEEAIGVWQEYEDKNWIDPPMVERPAPEFPSPPAFSPLPSAFKSFFAILNPGEGPYGKAVESEPGVVMIFEHVDKAKERAAALGDDYKVYAVLPQVLGPVELDAEFADDAQ